MKEYCNEEKRYTFIVCFNVFSFIKNIPRDGKKHHTPRGRERLFVQPNEVSATQIKERYFSGSFPLTLNKVPLNLISTSLSGPSL